MSMLTPPPASLLALFAFRTRLTGFCGISRSFVCTLSEEQREAINCELRVGVMRECFFR